MPIWFTFHSSKQHRLTLELNSGAGELYDLHNDPQEMQERFDDPAYACVRRKLTDMVKSRPDDALATPLPQAGMESSVSQPSPVPTTSAAITFLRSINSSSIARTYLNAAQPARAVEASNPSTRVVAEIDHEVDYYESCSAGLGAELERRVAALDRFPFTLAYESVGENGRGCR